MNKDFSGRHGVLEPINLSRRALNQDEEDEKKYELKKMMEEGIVDNPETTNESKSDDSMNELA